MVARRSRLRLVVEMDAEVLPDHRLAYLDYEGPISGDRGSVTRWDRGTYDVEHQSGIGIDCAIKRRKTYRPRVIASFTCRAKTRAILFYPIKPRTASCSTAELGYNLFSLIAV